VWSRTYQLFSTLISIYSELRTRDGSAESPNDYTVTSQNLEIAPGDTNKNMIIPIRNDQLTEGAESIILELTTTNNNQINIGRSSAVVLIQDDDGKIFYFYSLLRYCVIGITEIIYSSVRNNNNFGGGCCGGDGSDIACG
jgi:hypothetical protein